MQYQEAKVFYYIAYPGKHKIVLYKVHSLRLAYSEFIEEIQTQHGVHSILHAPQANMLAVDSRPNSTLLTHHRTVLQHDRLQPRRVNTWNVLASDTEEK